MQENLYDMSDTGAFSNTCPFYSLMIWSVLTSILLVKQLTKGTKHVYMKVHISRVWIKESVDFGDL